MAPEILENKVDLALKSKLDVYSFGIIMHEMFFETLPYRTNSEQFDSIIALGTSIVRGLRPHIPEHQIQGISGAEKLYLNVMQQCWSEKPQDRPSFENILSEFSRMGY